MDLDMAMMGEIETTPNDRAIISVMTERELFGHRIPCQCAGEFRVLADGAVVLVALISADGVKEEALSVLQTAILTGRMYRSGEWVRWKLGRTWAEKIREGLGEGKYYFPK